MTKNKGIRAKRTEFFIAVSGGDGHRKRRQQKKDTTTTNQSNRNKRDNRMKQNQAVIETIEIK
jgi:hypothetical protein